MGPNPRSNPFNRLLFALLALIGLVLIGTVGFQAIENFTPVDAFSMAVITLSTVGFGEIHTLSPGGRMFTIGLILGGAGVVAYSLATLTDFLFNAQWREQWTRYRKVHMLKHLTNHIIVCGYGRVGRFVAHELRAEHTPFVVIDSDPAKIAHIERDGFIALQGNAANELHLREAGIDRAQGLVAAVNSDAENVFIVLTARGMRPELTIVARANYEESEAKLLKAGATRVILPYRISGRRMVTMLTRPEVADFLDEVAHASGVELLIDQVNLTSSSALCGLSLAKAQDLLRARLGITLLACRSADGQMRATQSPVTPLAAGAQLIALGTREQLKGLIEVASGRESPAS